ncbi:thioesterase II family protein [Amycolatopsis sp. cmx-4-68]|uniref:thioesterase II family protein n=1 Tax=Amycolatopsis sp. cmx-4-68 TaxID=2790938 RepID=UPI00397A3D8F
MSTATPGGDPWIRRFHPAGDAPVRLVCLPHAGGSASFFFPLSQALSPRLDVLCVQYPGRQDRRHEPLVDDIGKLADALVPVLAPWCDRPTALFGHSMGASLAFEVACRLEAAGTEVAAVIASGRRAPSEVREEFTHLKDDDGLIADLKSLSGTQARIFEDEEILRMALPAIRNDYRAAETYRFGGGGPLRAPIHVHTGDADPKVNLDEARAWARHTTGEFSLQTYSGGHFYLVPHAARMTRAIAETLTTARRAG